MHKVLLALVLASACSGSPATVALKSECEFKVPAIAAAPQVEVVEITAQDHAPVDTISVAEMQHRVATRRVRRWAWEANPDVVATAWNVPEEDGEEATATALHRIFGSEVSWRGEGDMLGIWQVVQVSRARHCDRGRARHHVRITECSGGEETYLSAMRRLARHVTGMVPPTRSRQVWIRSVTLACERPDGFPEGGSWDQYRPQCLEAARLARRLVSGQDRRRLTDAVPITWGGRCEDEGGACDDSIACRRGLARIPYTPTANAFWCRPGTRGCSLVRDPICGTEDPSDS